MWRIVIPDIIIEVVFAQKLKRGSTACERGGRSKDKLEAEKRKRGLNSTSVCFHTLASCPMSNATPTHPRENQGQNCLRLNVTLNYVIVFELALISLQLADKNNDFRQPHPFADDLFKMTFWN